MSLKYMWTWFGFHNSGTNHTPCLKDHTQSISPIRLQNNSTKNSMVGGKERKLQLSTLNKGKAVIGWFRRSNRVILPSHYGLNTLLQNEWIYYAYPKGEDHINPIISSILT